MSNTTLMPRSEALFACATIISGTALGLAGIDLVLPSVPEMPLIFGTTIATAQLVLAAFVFGSTLGMLLFGSLAAHYGRRRLFIWSLFAYAVFSFACIFSPTIWWLISLRFLQGAAASGAAVLAPGLIRGLFSELGAMRAISAMGSIEALVPGLAPIMGLWLYSAYGWESTFTITAILVSIVCVIVIFRPKLIPSVGTKKQTGQGSYLALLKNTTYIRYAMGHALTVGGLIAFVFTAPAVIIETMGGTIEDFILMQMVGVATFFVAANTTGSLVKKWGAETIIMLGTLVCVGATLILIAYALWGPNKPQHLVAMFWVLNTGVGLRAGPCFVSALKAAVDDDDRASALMILSITAIIALATAALAPLISLGLLALTITTFLIVVPALLLMIYIKPVNSTVGPQTTP